MADRFCTNCGAPLSGDTKFCTSCGAPVAPIASPDATMKMPPVAGPATAAGASAAATSFNAPAADAQRAAGGSGNLTPTTKGVLIGVAAGVVVIAVLLLVFVFHPWDASSANTGSSTSTQQQSTSSTSTTTSTSTSTSTSSSAAANEDATYNSLLAAYNKLDGFDSRIRTCATDYNNTVTAGSSSVRSANYSTCKTLQSEIAQEITSLGKLNVSTSSKYYQDYKNISNLQNDLKKRIDVITQSWAIDVQYSNPSAHISEIEAPIVADNDANGINIYKTDYVNNYDAAKPVKK